MSAPNDPVPGAAPDPANTGHTGHTGAGPAPGAGSTAARAPTHAPAHAPASSPTRAGAVRVSSTQLFAGAHEVLIEHHGALYRLKQTSLGKLILTK